MIVAYSIKGYSYVTFYYKKFTCGFLLQAYYQKLGLKSGE